MTDNTQLATFLRFLAETFIEAKAQYRKLPS